MCSLPFTVTTYKKCVPYLSSHALSRSLTRYYHFSRVTDHFSRVTYSREEPRTANVIAVTDQVVCYVVEREKFMKLIGGLEFEKYSDKDAETRET